jgi:hypothetical protein
MDYFKIPSLNNSGMTALAISPAHYQAWRQSGIDSPALRFGRAVHTAWLEPEKFNSEFVIANPRTKAAKEDSRTAISETDYAAITGMMEALDRHSIAAKIREEAAAVEVSRRWIDQDSGANCKGRADIISPDGMIFDLKTTTDIKGFRFSIKKYAYDRQAAFYVDGWSAPGFGWIVIEKTPPYGVRIIRASANTLADGRDLYKPLCALYAQCELLGEWPGLAETIEEI